jgi:RNA polymerase sigma-70 factor, ECF subfamily
MTRARFDEIIHLHSRKLFMIAMRIVRNRQEAEDLVQELFLKLWNMGDKLDGYKDIEAVAVTMIKNKSIDVVRRRKFAGEELTTAVLIVEGSSSPFDKMVSSETRTIMQNIIAKLPGNFKDLIQLREIEGLSYEEISGLTGSNINSLRVSISRARQIIKDEYLKIAYERGASERITGKVL